MKLERFEMERMQSTYENLVEFNLSESGVRPLTPRELIEDTAELDGLLDQPLAYTQSNGTLDLRRSIASMYPGATVDHVEVTNGGSEANFITTFNLIEPGDDVVMLVPNYMQTWGLSRAFGGTIREWRLVEDPAAGRWRADLEALDRLVTARTKMIVICNPNNPTGARLTAADLDAVARAADRHGAWILSDEVYRGAELDGRVTDSMWGRSERVIVTSGLSKAYGLPGLRIGWIVGPAPLVASLWSYHDYVTIAPGALSDRLARVALQPERRARVFERTRAILRRNLPLVEEWLRDAGGFHWIRPEAGAIVYVRYDHKINSTVLVNRLRVEKSVLVVPGDHFGMDGYLRLGFGEPPDYNRAGLERLKELLSSVPAIA
jgi:aspartate/methionine/tyrosine aminotransferase